MGRLSIAMLVAVAAGCSGTIDEGAQTAGLTPTQQIALTAWLQGAEPAFHASTCDTCHAGQMLAAGAPAYLLGDTDVAKRDAAIATLPPVINLGSPRSSRVLVKGLHEGPVLDAPDATQILLWIQDEHDARPVVDPPTTTAYTMMDCASGSAGSATCPIDSIDLTPAGAAGTITFTEMPIQGDDGMPATDMDALTITAGAAGLHVVHPLFGTVAPGGTGSGSDAGGPTFDALDRFFNVDMELGAGETLVLGQAIFSDFDHVNPIVVQFDTLTAKD